MIKNCFIYHRWVAYRIENNSCVQHIAQLYRNRKVVVFPNKNLCKLYIWHICLNSIIKSHEYLITDGCSAIALMGYGIDELTLYFTGPISSSITLVVSSVRHQSCSSFRNTWISTHILISTGANSSFLDRNYLNAERFISESVCVRFKL